MWVRSAVGWCRYYRRNHWKYGMVRDDEHLIHNKLVDWSVVEADEEMLNSAVSSLAATLWSLHQLGYRSRLVGQPFTGLERSPPNSETHRGRGRRSRVRPCRPTDNQWRRRGNVFARPAQPGETIETLEGPATAFAGDWVVRGADGEEWPVPAREFAERYAEADAPATATADP